MKFLYADAFVADSLGDALSHTHGFTSRDITDGVTTSSNLPEEHGGLVDTSGLGITLVDAEVGVLTLGVDTRYLGVEADLLAANAKVGANAELVGVKLMAEAAGASGNVNIPIFWSGLDLVVTVEGNIGSLGVEAGWFPSKGIGAKAAVFGGVGLFVNIRPSHE